MASRKECKRERNQKRDTGESSIPIPILYIKDTAGLITTLSSTDGKIYTSRLDPKPNKESQLVYKVTASIGTFLSHVSPLERRELYHLLNQAWTETITYLHTLMLVNRWVAEEELIPEEVGEYLKMLSLPQCRSVNLFRVISVWHKQPQYSGRCASKVCTARF